MNKKILIMAILGSTFAVQANNFNMPTWGNGYNNGSSWNMPSMNWGNNNGYGNGTNWNMPSMNWGNNNGYSSGTNWNMPSMNWGNNNGYSNGTNWNMPNMNWGSGNNGSNWNFPSFNWNNNNQPWNNGYNYRRPTPNVQFIPPAQGYFIPQAQAKPTAPAMRAKPIAPQPTAKAAAPAATAKTKVTAKIPTPDEVKGVILAPENKSEQKVEGTK